MSKRYRCLVLAEHVIDVEASTAREAMKIVGESMKENALDYRIGEVFPEDEKRSSLPINHINLSRRVGVPPYPGGGEVA